MLLKCLGCHPLKSLRWRTGEKLVPLPVAFDFGEKPRSDCLLVVFRQPVCLCDRLFEQFAHARMLLSFARW